MQLRLLGLLHFYICEMSALNFLNHVLNFTAPAFFVALLLALFGRFVFSASLTTITFWKQITFNFATGVVVLVIGLVVFGHDGHMGTYSALVVFCGVCQWFFATGWRR